MGIKGGLGIKGGGGGKWHELIEKQGVYKSPCGLAIYIKIYISLKAKEEELWKLKCIFHHVQI
jgi:hypothetical protein